MGAPGPVSTPWLHDAARGGAALQNVTGKRRKTKQDKNYPQTDRKKQEEGRGESAIPAKGHSLWDTGPEGTPAERGKETYMLTGEQEKKRTYLGQYRQLDAKITRLLEEQRAWREKAMRMTPVLTPVPGGKGGGGPIERPIEKVIAMEGDINAAIDALIDLRREIQGAIEKVPDENLQLLLTYRYIDGLSFEKIAEKLHYGYQWVYKLHRKALDALTLQQAMESEGPHGLHYR